MAHILNREALRVVNKDERGRVTYRRRYKKGDEVDVSKMDEFRVQTFVDEGVLVSSEEDLDEPEEDDGTTVLSEPQGDTTEPSGDNKEDGGDDTINEDGDEHVVDKYDDMDYSALQQAAKSRDLNGGGSAQDLRARLRADDDA